MIDVQGPEEIEKGVIVWAGNTKQGFSGVIILAEILSANTASQGRHT